MKFKIGDTVNWMGVVGKVTLVNNYQSEGYENRIAVEFENTSVIYYFNEDGKAYSWHKESSLVLVSRPEKEITLTKSKFAKMWDKNANQLEYKPSEYSVYFKDICKILELEDDND